MSQPLLDAAPASVPAPFAAPQAAGHAAASAAGGAGEVLLALGIVLLVIFACAWAMKRLRGLPRGGARVLAIVDEIAVGQKERVVLLACGGARLLVGVAAGQVSLLHEVPPDAFASAGTDTAAVPSGAAATDFRTLLRRSLGLAR
ncbi:MAG: hypothetical protein CMLOHMNK_00671 [Steroidobacteraceae bacterium]|nr:hypothetical protein [Steroidobacteraceae bacterium]